jgi:hypothetical protein
MNKSAKNKMKNNNIFTVNRRKNQTKIKMSTALSRTAHKGRAIEKNPIHTTYDESPKLI